jgi:putative transposase
MRDDFVGKHRSTSDLKVHLVLTTKYRRKVFDGKMIERLHDIYADLLAKWDCKLIEFNGEEDHIHLLFQYFPDIALNKLVNNLKSVSSRRIRQEYGEKLDAIYKSAGQGSEVASEQTLAARKDVLWNGSYFVASCGGVTVTTLRKYIEEQDKPA